MNKVSLNLFVLLLALLCTLGHGQAGSNMSCADIVKAHGGVNISDAPALWEIPMSGAIELLSSYGASVTPSNLSFSDEIQEATSISCIEPYLFTNEIDRMAQTFQLNIYDTLLGKRVASLDTFGLPIEGWVIGDIIAANLYTYIMDPDSIVISLTTQSMISDTLPSQYAGSKILMVSGNHLLRERTSHISGNTIRHIESLRITESSLIVMESCSVELPEGFTVPLEYTLNDSGLKVIPKSSKDSMSPYLIESCKNVVETFLNSHK
jgi:hypothetical protein